MSKFLMCLSSASQVVCVEQGGAAFHTREEMKNVHIVADATILVGLDGLIADVGPHEEVMARHPDAQFEREISCLGKAVLPGLCDAHTHPVWAGDRVHEFAAKLAGATYMEIHAKGGGIGFSVRETRQATEEHLLEDLLARLARFSRHGTTLAECKSGYGLNLECELKMLRTIHRAKSAQQAVDLVGSFCAAHSIPSGSNEKEYTDCIVKEMIPALKKAIEEGSVSPSLVDVFLEKGVFSVESTKRILVAASESCNLEHNFHGDELSYSGSGELAGELGSLAVSHLEHVSDEGIIQLAKRPSFAVLLPTTAVILRLEHPPARRLIDAGVPVALGSDFNPNAHCFSLPMTMFLATVHLHMSMEEALTATTLNAAASMGKSRTHGSIEIGKFADFVIVDNPAWEHLIYQIADPPIETVIKSGKVVFER